jgi:hypothetical protein
VVSAFISSPTYGGASDLAHLSVLSGIDLSNPMRHDLLLTTERPTLSTLFRANGYRVFGLYPALFWEWPERAYYGFDEFLASRELDYRGPPLGYWKIPDQFALARFEQLHPRGPDAPPRFVFFPTITCHFPFSPVPPYQPDWQRVLGDKPFDAAELARAESEQVAWLNMFPTTCAWSTTPCAGWAASCARKNRARRFISWSATTSRRPTSAARVPRGTCRCTSCRATRRC